MKKKTLAITALFASLSFASKAQTWSGSTPGDIYYNSGYVGIGTASPSTKLTVYDNSNSFKMPRLIKDGYFDELGLYNFSSTDYYRTEVGFRRGRGTAASPAATQSGDWIGSFNFWGANSGASFSNPSASIIGIVDGTPGSAYVPGKIVFQTSDGSATTTDRMTIKNNGHVAIGVGDGSDLLTVAGSTRIVAYGGNGFLGYDAATGGNHIFSLTRQSNDLALSALGGIGFSTLKTSPSTGYSMFINTSGKVGIGTTTPDELLSVKGIIHSQEVKIDLTGWSDYVLKPAYTLPTLSSVKTYIDQNHRLPDVPSEAEMVKNGLNVGEMNKPLMKKVEELTLYLISQNKKIQSQEEKLMALEQRMNSKNKAAKISQQHHSKTF